MPAGRPSPYTPQLAELAQKIAKLGATDIEIADVLGIDVRTLYRWKNEYEEFCQALKAGKKAADTAVETSLYRRATGYTFSSVKIFMPAGAKEPVYAPYTEHCPPDTTAAIFWLKNRRPDLWRDKREMDVTHNAGKAFIDILRAVNERRAANGALADGVDQSSERRTEVRH